MGVNMVFNFSEALYYLKSGKKVSRTGWNGKGMYIEMQAVTSTSKMTKPYVFMSTAEKDLIPWLCSQADMFANDWQLVE